MYVADDNLFNFFNLTNPPLGNYELSVKLQWETNLKNKDFSAVIYSPASVTISYLSSEVDALKKSLVAAQASTTTNWTRVERTEIKLAYGWYLNYFYS
jgi:hypothetical protein